MTNAEKTAIDARVKEIIAGQARKDPVAAITQAISEIVGDDSAKFSPLLREWASAEKRKDNHP